MGFTVTLSYLTFCFSTFLLSPVPSVPFYCPLSPVFMTHIFHYFPTFIDEKPEAPKFYGIFPDVPGTNSTTCPQLLTLMWNNQAALTIHAKLTRSEKQKARAWPWTNNPCVSKSKGTV